MVSCISESISCSIIPVFIRAYNAVNNEYPVAALGWIPEGIFMCCTFLVLQYSSSFPPEEIPMILHLF